MASDKTEQATPKRREEARERGQVARSTDANTAIVIRPVTTADTPAWEEMRCAMWPDGRDDHAQEIASFLAGTLAEPEAVAQVPVDHFDGLDKFEDLPRDGRRVADYWF